MSENQEALNFKEFMELIGVKKSTMYKIMLSPYAPKFTCIGSKKIITRADALKWVEDYAGKKII